MKMKIKFFIDGKKVSKKKAEEVFGKETIKSRVKTAKERFMEDPYILNEWADGLMIRFE